jgi:hypothetical protein
VTELFILLGKIAMVLQWYYHVKYCIIALKICSIRYVIYKILKGYKKMNATSSSIFNSYFIFILVLGLVILGFIYFGIKNYYSGNKFMSLGRDIKVVISIWIPVLIIELFNFYNVVHRPNETSELIFHITLIIVSLVVGVTVIFAFKNNGNG